MTADSLKKKEVFHLNKTIQPTVSMIQHDPIVFRLKDGTHVTVIQLDAESYEFHLTRLNSERHNFIWKERTGAIEESYETRFDQWQLEAIDLFKDLKAS